MTFLPIVERELRVAARLSSTYRNRSLIAGGVALAALLTLFFGSIVSRPSAIGAAMFKMISVLALVFCVLEGARKTADCLSEEKREGTLGLLFLTDLKGYDIVLGKLVGTSLNSVYGLVSILPVLALPLLLGGVLAGEYWRAVLALMNLLFLSLCVGIFISSISREEQKAMGGALLVMALLCGWPWWPGLTSLRPLSPAYAFYAAFEAYYRAGGGHYWESLAVGQALSWLSLIGACLAVPRSWQERAVRPEETRGLRQWLMRWPRYMAWRERTRQELLVYNPVKWLTSSQPGFKFGLYSMTVIAAMFALFFCLGGGIGTAYYVAACWALNLVVKAWMAVQASRCTAEARRNDTLEMLLVTPLRVERIVSGQIQGLLRVFLLPAILILGIEIGGYIAGMAMAMASSANGVGDEISGAAIVGTGYLVLFALDVAAVTWAGLWFGLTAKKESHAIAKTVLFVLVLPYFGSVFFLFCFFPGAALFYLSSFLWIIWAKGRLETQYRAQASRTDGFVRPDGPVVFLPQFNRPPPLPPIINR